MNNLYKYLDRNNIPYTREKYGSGYFYGAEIRREGVRVEFNIPEDGRQEIALAKYCKKYGYRVTGGGYSGIHFFRILTEKDSADIDLYLKYQNASAAAVEKEIHLGQRDDEFLKGIMSFYEEEYRRAVK